MVPFEQFVFLEFLPSSFLHSLLHFSYQFSTTILQAQHSPQAIFTSFKLERSEQINVVGLTPSSADGADNHTVPGAAGHTHNIPSGGTFITNLTPRNGIRKRSRHWAVESQRETAVVAPKIATRTEPPETPRVPPAQVSESLEFNPSLLSPLFLPL